MTNETQVVETINAVEFLDNYLDVKVLALIGRNEGAMDEIESALAERKLAQLQFEHILSSAHHYFSEMKRMEADLEILRSKSEEGRSLKTAALLRAPESTLLIGAVEAPQQPIRASQPDWAVGFDTWKHVPDKVKQ